jgi:hypothetical protein
MILVITQFSNYLANIYQVPKQKPSAEAQLSSIMLELTEFMPEGSIQPETSNVPILVVDTIHEKWTPVSIERSQATILVEDNIQEDDKHGIL